MSDLQDMIAKATEATMLDWFSRSLTIVDGNLSRACAHAQKRTWIRLDDMKKAYTQKQINAMSTERLIQYASDDFGDVAVIKYYGIPWRCQISQGSTYWICEGKTMRESVQRAMYAVRFLSPEGVWSDDA